MTLERKRFAVELKADEAGHIEGYGSVFGEIDGGGDQVMPGAFADSLASGRSIKMLWQHDPSQVIGVWDQASEDDRGLRVRGRFARKVARAQEVEELVRMRAVDGLSIGYRTVDARKSPSGSRQIVKAEVWEVSLVTFPMNTSAVIDTVKAAGMTEREIERKLTQDAGFSRSAARALMRGGIEGLGVTQDAEAKALDEVLAQLRRIAS